MILEMLRDDHDIAQILMNYSEKQKASGRPADLAATLRRGDLSALVALEEGVALGVIGWKVRQGKGTISLLALAERVSEEEAVIDTSTAMIRGALSAMQAQGVGRVTHLLRQTPAEWFAAAFQQAGFQALLVERWVRDLSSQIPFPPAPAGYQIVPWRPRFTRQVVTVFLAIPRDPLESLLWPEYDTSEGVSDLVDSLTSPLPIVPPAVTYVATDDEGNIIGYILSRVTRQGIGWIGEVGVHPDHQHKGIGRLLVATSLQAMTTHRLSQAALTVLASNEPARRLYRSFGFACQDSQYAFVWSTSS